MIDTFFNILKKSLVAAMFVIVGFAMTYIPQPHPSADSGYSNVEMAHAGGVVIDPVNLVQNTLTAIQTAATWVINNWLYLKESVLDGIAWVIAKEFVSSLVSDVVDWINSGFDGSPRFVQDLDGFLREAADVAIGEYINELGGLGSFVCEPFRLDVQLAVALQYNVNRENRVPECTLTDIIDNFEDFIAGDFQAGGWQGWFDLVSQPQSSPYGSILTAQSKARGVVSNTKGDELKLLDFGKGFLSTESCESIPGDDGPIEQCHIVTPGDILSGQINKSLGAGQDSLVQADEFNEILAALIGQLAGRVFSGAAGLLGLSGGDTGSYTPYSRDSFSADLLDDGVINDSVGAGSSGGSSDLGDPDTDLGGGSGSGGAFILDAVDGLVAKRDLVDDYIADLTAFIANPLNEETDVLVAEILLNEAQDVRDRIEEDRLAAIPLVAAYAALEADYLATDDPVERNNIRNAQADILVEFSALAIITDTELNIYTGRWDDMLDRDVPPPFFPGPGPGPGPGPLP